MYRYGRNNQAAGGTTRGFVKNDVPGEKRLSVEGLCDTQTWLDALPPDAPKGRRAVVQALAVAADMGTFALLVLSVPSVVSGTFNPFIYFRF